jgi:hypothetical protein
MRSAETQFEPFSLFNPAFVPDAAEIRNTLSRRPKTVTASPVISSASPGLLKTRDFILPELVGYADNGDLSVGGCVDPVQVEQVFQLADADEQKLRALQSLSYAEHQLERRRYQDWLKRQASKGERTEEQAEWSRLGPSAEGSFVAWWTRKEERRRTSLLRKANRLANCGVTGRRLDCSAHPEEHRFYGSFTCGVRYCRSCGTRIFSELFGKYMGLWSSVKDLVVRPGFRSATIIATLDFTAVNLGRMPTPEEIRDFNQDVRICVRLALQQLDVDSSEYGFLWCDEFGGKKSETESYNTNLHAHGVYVGPFIPHALLLETWIKLREKKDGARGVYIKQQKLDHPPADICERECRRFARALGHALKYTGKHVARSDGKRLAELEAAFHGVRRVHTMGLFYHADLSCSCQCEFCGGACDKSNGHGGGHRCKHHRTDNRCPMCPGYLMFPRESGYALLSDLRREHRLDLEKTRREINRERVFAGPRGDPQ